jgi:electron transport complex protein RnfG
MSKNLLIFTSKRDALLLSAFAAVCTLLVSITYVLTAPVIEKQEQQDLLNKLNQVLVPTKFDNNPLENCFRLTDYNIFGDEEPHFIYRATMQDKPYALVFQTQTLKGYNGLIKMMVAVDKKGKVQGVRALKHQETPGLGDKIDLEKSDWVLSFNNMNVTSEQDKNWFVKKDSGYVDQFTGATITPRAVTNQLRHSILYVTLNFSSLFTQENQCEPALIPVELVTEPEILIEPEIETEESDLIPEETAPENTTPEEAITEAEIVTPETATEAPITDASEAETTTESGSEGTTTDTEGTKPEIKAATTTDSTATDSNATESANTDNKFENTALEKADSEKLSAESKAEEGAETDVVKPETDAVKPEGVSDVTTPAETKPKTATEDAKSEEEVAKPKADDTSTDEAKPAKAEADKVETKDEEPVTKPAESSDETPSASSDKASDKSSDKESDEDSEKESDEDSEKDAIDESETPKKEVPND